MPLHNQFLLGADNRPNPAILMRAGPLLQVEVAIPAALENYLQAHGSPIPDPIAGWALIDTGASRTGVHGETIAALGVNPIGLATVGTAGGQRQQRVYPARFRFPDARWEFEFGSTIGFDLSGQTVGGRDIIVLLGREILSRTLLVYNGPGGFFSLAVN